MARIQRETLVEAPIVLLITPRHYTSLRPGPLPRNRDLKETIEIPLQ